MAHRARGGRGRVSGFVANNGNGFGYDSPNRDWNEIE